MSGTRPTGRLHIGHLVGALAQWVELQTVGEAFFEIADLHAYTTGFEHPQTIRDSREELVLDWLAAGVDPKRATIYLQSAIPEIMELQALLAMIVPLSWLQRVPTFKDQIEALGPEISTYGFLGYPLLQLCDIAAFRAHKVPVGKDQMSHLEFGREVVRRFNHLYGPTLVEPEGILSEFPAVPGTDGRKMSKSYGNTIDLADDEEATTKKIRASITDPQKVRRNDPGHPEICPVFAMHHLCNAERVPWIERRAGLRGVQRRARRDNERLAAPGARTARIVRSHDGRRDRRRRLRARPRGRCRHARRRQESDEAGLRTISRSAYESPGGEHAGAMKSRTGSSLRPSPRPRGLGIGPSQSPRRPTKNLSGS
jgi:tryptophanyl-tRNA synthetase